MTVERLFVITVMSFLYRWTDLRHENYSLAPNMNGSFRPAALIIYYCAVLTFIGARKTKMDFSDLG